MPLDPNDTPANRVITREQYFTIPFIGIVKAHTDRQDLNARFLLATVNKMLLDLGWDFPVDPDTATCISGARGGRGDGGFRDQQSSTGVIHSQHRDAHAVDVYDPENKLDAVLTDEILAKYDLYREAPAYTLSWCHLQNLPPLSGHRTFIP